MVPHQRPITLVSSQMVVQSQVFDNPSALTMTLAETGSSSSAGDVSSSDVAAAFTIMSDGGSSSVSQKSTEPITGSVLYIVDNIYTGELATPLLGLTLLDTSSGEVHAYSDGMIYSYIYTSYLHNLSLFVDFLNLHGSINYWSSYFVTIVMDVQMTGLVEIQIPLSTPDSIDPVCQLWDATLEAWSQSGCEVANYHTSAGHVVCHCTHLTTFSCPLIPPIVIPEWEMLTWDNLLAQPLGLIVITSVTVVTIFISFWAQRYDDKLDQQGIRTMHSLLQLRLQHQSRAPNVKREARKKIMCRLSVNERRLAYSNSEGISKQSIQHWAGKRWWTGVMVLLKKHTWLSVYGRPETSSIGSLDRVWILYNGLLTSAASSAIFVEADDFLEVAGVWAWCGFFSMLVTLIEYRLCFQRNNYRYHKLFMATAEAAVSKLYPDQVPSTPPNRRKLIFQLLKRQYGVRPGYMNWRLWMCWISMSSRHFGQTPVVDFRLSKYAILRQRGFDLVKNELTPAKLIPLWKQDFAFSNRRKLGYVLLFMISLGAATLLLMYMLQFSLSSNPTEAQDRFICFDAFRDIF